MSLPPHNYVTGFWKTLRMGFFVKIEFDVSPYPRANPPASLRPIALFALKTARFVCDRATTILNEKLRSKGVAMHALAFPYTTRVPEIN